MRKQLDEMIEAHGPFPEGTDFHEMMGVLYAREARAFPADATNEEIVTIFTSARAGYRGMTVELLRDNRYRALSTLDAVEERIRKRDAAQQPESTNDT